MNDGPDDPLTQLQKECSTHHEVYLAYIEAGFTPDQAFAFVVVILQETIRRQ